MGGGGGWPTQPRRVSVWGLGGFGGLLRVFFLVLGHKVTTETSKV